MKIKILLFSILPLMIILYGCDHDPDPVPEFVPYESETDGNLLIINNSNENLVLAEGEEILRHISSSGSDYRTHIPNESGTARELTLYKWDDVKDDPDNLPIDLLFKKWKVPLSKDKNIEKSVTWHVSSDSEYQTQATVSFSYFGGTNSSVDVFLDGRKGSKIMTLKPGDQNSKTGIDYGNHTLHYRFWYSDQNTSEGEVEEGWKETRSINGEEKTIWLVLNENRSNHIEIIPHFESNYGAEYGNINIANNYGEPVQIYVGDQLIESICYLENGSNVNLSAVAHASNTTFIIPINPDESGNIGEKTFTFYAKNLTNGGVIDEEEITIVADNTVNWVVE